MTHVCNAILQSGERRGQQCGNRATHPFHTNKWYCSRHKHGDEANILCEYGDTGVPLADIDTITQLITDDAYGEENVKKLKGYINIRVGKPIFYDNTKISLALISTISPCCDNFTRASLATELAISINHILERPDVYNLSGVSIQELVLMKITYDPIYGMFDAIIRKID